MEILKVFTDSHTMAHSMSKTTPASRGNYTTPRDANLSYLDEGSGGPENDFTNRNTTFMSWNLMHLANLLKSNGHYPARGNSRTEWDAGIRPGFETS